MTDDEMVEVARDAAVAEAKERGWLPAGAEAPSENPATGASVLIGILGRAHLRRLRGEPSALTLECRRRSAAHEERMREQDVRERDRRAGRR